jgi:hypothetical protein
MRIVGKWFACSDGVLRPILEGYAADVVGTEHQERFLLDCGADVTVFTASFFQRLGLPSRVPQPGAGLAGVGGSQASALVRTTRTLYAEDGSPARIQGDFAVFTDTAAADMSSTQKRMGLKTDSTTQATQGCSTPASFGMMKAIRGGTSSMLPSTISRWRMSKRYWLPR